jgi:hypothetical protein
MASNDLEPSAAQAVTPLLEGDDPARVLFSWRSHPARQGGRRLGIALGAVIVIPIALWPSYGPFFGLLAFIILGGSLLPFFLPTEYVLYSGGLESVFLRVHRRFTWDQFRSYYPDKNGVLLSPFTHPSRLENFRGVYLRFNGQSARVLEVVSDRIKIAPGEDPSGKGTAS